MSRQAISDLPPFDQESGWLNIIIETPKGSRTKFKVDESVGAVMFDKALPIGQSFPFDFGFVPSTIGEDGDPLDVLLLVDEPTFPGCLAKGKLLGVIEAEQMENGETKRNDRFIAVPIEAKSQKPPSEAPASLESAGVDKIAKFFVAYNELQGKKFKILQFAGPDEATTLIKQGQAEAKRHTNKRQSQKRQSQKRQSSKAK